MDKQKFDSAAAKSSVEKGFSKISSTYEDLEKTSSLIIWMRKRVREHLTKQLDPKNSVLEINCGSGIDAVFLAKQGHFVHATDIADGMLKHVANKIQTQTLAPNLTFEKLDNNNLLKLKPKTYNHIFSNFGGLNCSSLTELEVIFSSFKQLLKPNGKITLVIMPKICLWELVKCLKGNKIAFRRLTKNGVLANVEAEKVHTYYHSYKTVKKLLSNNFKNIKAENICFFAPTGHHVNFPSKYPLLFKLLIAFDAITNKIPFLKGYGDYYILSATVK